MAFKATNAGSSPASSDFYCFGEMTERKRWQTVNLLVSSLRGFKSHFLQFGLGRIWTYGIQKYTSVFKTGAFNHSATNPFKTPNFLVARVNLKIARALSRRILEAWKKTESYKIRKKKYRRFMDGFLRYNLPFVSFQHDANAAYNGCRVRVKRRTRRLRLL